MEYAAALEYIGFRTIEYGPVEITFWSSMCETITATLPATAAAARAERRCVDRMHAVVRGRARPANPLRPV